MTITKFRAVMLGLLALALVFGAFLAGGGQLPFSAPQSPAALAAPAANVPVPPPPGADVPKCDLSTGDHEMANNETCTVPAGFNIKGDVFIWDGNAWVKHFDEGADSAKTGALTTVTQDVVVNAPFGANVTNRTVADLETEMKASGCENNAGCTAVTKYVWPKGATAPLRLLGASAYPAPTAGPEPTALAAAPTAVTGNCPQMAYDPGDSAEVPAGCVVLGDVIIAMGTTDKQLATDSDAHTGMVTVMNEAATVMFPSGGTVIDPRGREIKDIALQQAQVANLTGCAGAPVGCDVTGIYQFPGGAVEWIKDATK